MSNLLRGVAVAALALVMLWATQVRAQATAPFELVTAAEAKQAALAEAQAQARPPVRTRQVVVPRGNAPAIRVLAPNAADAAVPAPVRIQVAFKPAPGTRIVPSSFRVLYGLLKLDLTERLRPHSTVNEEGFLVEGAKVPDGQHRLILQVADDQGNTTEQELRIRVAAAP
jgi:hypothetical protein